MSNDIYVVGIGMTKFGKYLEKSIKTLTGEALDVVFKDCGLSRNDIEAAWFGNSFQGLFTMQHSIRGEVALSANGIQGVSITNVENACATGSTAFHGAWTAVKAGLYDCVLAIGTEKMYNEDRGKVMLSYATGSDVEDWGKMMEIYKEAMEQRKLLYPQASQEQTDPLKALNHSPAMDMYSVYALMHMKKYGTTQQQIAMIAAKAHNNSTMNPLAQYTFPMSVEQVMQDREVSFPLTRAMCAPVGDGSAAAILCNEKFLKKHSLEKRAIKVRASILRSGERNDDPQVSERASAAAYTMAGLGPKDLNILEVHDATSFGELIQLEQLGFCPEGEGGRLVESGATALDGKIPVNTGGGLISRGHPVGATGIAQVFELSTQLRGEAGKRQVKNPRIAMAENGGGLLGRGEAAMCIHILEAPAK